MKKYDQEEYEKHQPTEYEEHGLFTILLEVIFIIILLLLV